MRVPQVHQFEIEGKSIPAGWLGRWLPSAEKNAARSRATIFGISRL